MGLVISRNIGIRRPRPLAGSILLASLFLQGCASQPALTVRGNRASYESNHHGVANGASPRLRPSPSPAGAEKPGEPAASYTLAADDEVSAAPAKENIGDPSPSSPPATPDRPAQARQVSYRGQLRMASLDPDALLDTAENLVSALGGYIESRSGRTMVIQVPAQNFAKLFQQVRGLGEVQLSRRSAEDLTEAVEGNDLELKLRRNQLARLKAILARETKVDGRAALLQEIRRVSEDIARLQAQGALLQKRIRYSRLDLEAVALAAPPPRALVPPPSMAWISSLFPNDPAHVSPEGSRALELAQSPEFVRTSDGYEKTVWAAASSDGALVQAWKLEVRPDGDADFWREAVLHFRGREFASADTSRIGPWALVRLTSFDPAGPVWWLATRRPDGKGRVLVAQCRFTPAQEKRLGPATRRMIEETNP